MGALHSTPMTVPFQSFANVLGLLPPVGGRPMNIYCDCDWESLSLSEENLRWTRQERYNCNSKSFSLQRKGSLMHRKHATMDLWFVFMFLLSKPWFQINPWSMLFPKKNTPPQKELIYNSSCVRCVAPLFPFPNLRIRGGVGPPSEGSILVDPASSICLS